jgi:aspartate aminotransferase
LREGEFQEDVGPPIQILTIRQITSVQTISGTGANHLGALLISRLANKPLPPVYIGLPAWGNYKPLFRLVGLEVQHYNHYDPNTISVDFDTCIDAVRQAPRGSVFVLQGCCHNPTGADFDRDQWQILAKEIKLAGHLPFFDIAYQGLGDGLDEDAFRIRHFTQIGFEMIVCQSFSKNFGLYGERVGALHVVNRDQRIAANVNGQLRNLIRWEFSSSPAYGSRLVNLVLDDKEQVEDWVTELSEIRERLKRNRSNLFQLFSQVLSVSLSRQKVFNKLI